MSTRNFQIAVWFSLLSFASKLEQVANLRCAQANSASYCPWDGKWVVAYGLRGEGLVWLIGAVAYLLAANRESNCSLTRAIDGRLLRCGIVSSCQSAATSEIVKHFWATVRSAIASVGLYLFYGVTCYAHDRWTRSVLDPARQASRPGLLGLFAAQGWKAELTSWLVKWCDAPLDRTMER